MTRPNPTETVGWVLFVDRDYEFPIPYRATLWHDGKFVAEAFKMTRLGARFWAFYRRRLVQRYGGNDPSFVYRLRGRP